MNVLLTRPAKRRDGRPCCRALVVLSLLSIGCSDNPSLLVALDVAGNLQLANSGGKIHLEIVVADRAGAEPVAVADISPAEVRTRSRLFDAIDLAEGGQYRLAVRAQLDGEACKASGGVASGVSPPFVYSKAMDRLQVYIDCADAASLAGTLNASRLYHTATFLPEPRPYGRVVFVGGAEVDDPLSVFDANKAKYLDSIEVFDPAAGKFRTLAATLAQRIAFHASAAVDADALLVTGGIAVGEFGGSKQIVPVDGVHLLRDEDLGQQGRLSAPRALHAALRLANNRLLLVGGLVKSLTDTASARQAELYDPTTGQVVGAVPTPTHNLHVTPAAVAFGGYAAIFGGLWLPNVDLPEDLFCLDGPCGECNGPCFSKLPGFGKGRGRTDTAVVHVPCAEEQPGAIYVIGGKHDEAKQQGIPAEVYDEILCMDAQKRDVLRSVGKLKQPRALHSATLVRGPEGSQRLFVAGGFSDTGAAILAAELIPVSCQCPSAIAPSLIREATLSHPRAGHTATVLADGTVLLAGGVLASSTAERFNPAF